MSEFTQDGPRLSRRRLIELAAGAGAALAVAPAASASRAAAPKPKRGGRLRIGFVGEGAQETLDPGLQVASIDGARAANLYDTLLRVQPGNILSHELAVAFEPNKTATEWTVRLRSGVVFHDGSPLTADDLIYTIRRTGAPKSKYTGASAVKPIDLAKMRKLDKLTVRLPLKQPVAQLQWVFASSNMSILKNGFKDFSKPIGTGPFSFVSFKPGQNSVFKRNEHYWNHALPYVDELQFVSIPDGAARINALLGHQVDAAEFLSFVQAKQYRSNSAVKLLVSPGSVIVPMTMAVDLKPFDDVRVRQAFRLIAGRPELVQVAQLGFGEIGNDLFGKHADFYDHGLPQRHQDIDKAKFLLKQAGAEKLTVTLYSSTVVTGMLESANVFAQEAKKAGVTVNVDNGPADTYYSNHYLKAPFMQTSWSGTPISTWMNYAVVSDAPYNETHWKRPEFDKLVHAAQATVDRAKAQDLWNDAQRMLWNEGGYIIWGFQPYVDAVAPNVRGVQPSAFFNLGNYDFRTWWLS